MRVLCAASEVYPHAKTGGLADAITALAKEMTQQGRDVRLVLPGYKRLRAHFRDGGAQGKTVKLGGMIAYDLRLGRLDGLDIPVWIAINDCVFNSEESLYPRNAFNSFLRFSILSHAAAQLCVDASRDWRPDVLHANDWHSAMAFNFLEAASERDVARVLTVHNLAFKGVFPIGFLDFLGANSPQLAGAVYAGERKFSFLEEGVRLADKLSTVSRSYAREIQEPEFGFGFERLFSSRKRDLEGILNGVDYSIWHPEQDTSLPTSGAGFDAADKAMCKQHVQSAYGLKQDDAAILCAFTNRLTHQKMIDVVIKAAISLRDENFQFVFHGTGEAIYEQQLTSAARMLPKSIVYVPGFEERTEHLLHAASDVCLSPSRFEPCGLNPLYAMRYGAPPVVRPVGGPRDTVDDVFADPARGTGFYVDAETPEAVADLLRRVAILKQDTAFWSDLVTRVKGRNFSWRASAEEYLSLFARAMRGRRAQAQRAGFSVVPQARAKTG